MCKNSAIVTVVYGSQDDRKVRMVQVNSPLSLKADKFDDFIESLKRYAEPVLTDSGEYKRQRIAGLDDIVSIYAVGLGLASVDNKNAFGVAVTASEAVKADIDTADGKKKACADLKRTLDSRFADNDWCDSFSWKVTNNHINRCIKNRTVRHTTVNIRGTQTGNVERESALDVKGMCECIVSITQSKMQIVKSFV